MNITYVKELGNSKMRLALFSYAVSFVVICIITILIILLIKTKKKELVNNLKKIIPLFICIIVFLNNFINGVNAHILASKLIKDSQEMVSDSISGEIQDIYSKNKTVIIVVESKNYICMETKLKVDASVGGEYNIEYLINSNLIIKMEQLN